MPALPLPETHPWPFGTPELTAGLRRHTGDPALRILSIEERDMPNRRPSVGRIRGLQVKAAGGTGAYTFHLALKEPRQSGTTRAGSAGPAVREASFYRDLASYLPVRTPRIYALEPSGKWIVMECLREGRPPETWQADDYLRAVEQLLVLHDTFWNLGDDLAVYAWLARPLDATLEVHIRIAEDAVPRLLAAAPQETRQRPLPWEALLPRLVEHARGIAAVLRQMPSTLLHGDYWPGNIHMDAQGRLVVYDWQEVGIGPGLLDMVSLVQSSAWWFPNLPLPAERLIAHYRQGLERMTEQAWSDAEWRILWGHGLMWVFLTRWLDLLASTPAPLLRAQADVLTSLWLEPIHACLQEFYSEAE